VSRIQVGGGTYGNVHVLIKYWPGRDGSTVQVDDGSPEGTTYVELPEQSCDVKFEYVTDPEHDANMALPPDGNGLQPPSIARAVTILVSEQSGDEYVPTTKLLLKRYVSTEADGVPKYIALSIDEFPFTLQPPCRGVAWKSW